MKKEIPQKKWISAVLLIVYLCLAFAGETSLARDNGPEAMELKSSVANKPARFPHKKHQEKFVCGQCHHTKSDTGSKQPYEEDMEVRKCAACHNRDEMDNPKLNSFKLAAHGLCKECHKQNKGAAPTKCTGCHIK